MKNRSKLLKFDQISASVEATTNRRFTLRHFCQMLTAIPDLYRYEWKKATGEQSYSLILELPDEDCSSPDWVNKRAENLKAELLRITAVYHAKFLKQLITKRPGLKDYLSDFDPISQKSWYHEFDPNDSKFVPQLEPAKLTEQPRAKRGESVSEYLKRTRSSQKKESLNKCSLVTYSNMSIEKAQPNALASIIKPPSGSPKIESTINGIPTDLLKRIQEKEKVHIQEKKQAEAEFENNKHNFLKESLIRLIDSLKSIFSVRRVNTLYLSKLLSELEDSQRGRFDSTIDMKDYIYHIHSASPKWMKLISLPNGDLIKINPDYRKNSVRSDIEKYIKSLDAKTKDTNEETC